jgi:rRNA maturation endonuclease Nob1
MGSKKKKKPISTHETPQNKIKCPECKKIIDEGLIFCPECGNRIPEFYRFNPNKTTG